MKKTITTILTVVSMLTFSNCAQQAGIYGQNNTTRGAATGAAVGALAGGVIGNQSDSTGEGILLGAALGGLTGGVIGNQQDKAQAAAAGYSR